MRGTKAGTVEVAQARLGMSSATGSTSARWSPRRGSFATVAATPMEKTSEATRCVSLLLPSFSSFPILAAMIFRRPCPNSAFPASGPATAGACARPAGAKHWRRVARPAWCCGLLMKAPSIIVRSPISSVSPWTSPDSTTAISARIPIEAREGMNLAAGHRAKRRGVHGHLRRLASTKLAEPADGI